MSLPEMDIFWLEDLALNIVEHVERFGSRGSLSRQF
jgi:hypothetical protein